MDAIGKLEHRLGFNPQENDISDYESSSSKPGPVANYSPVDTEYTRKKDKRKAEVPDDIDSTIDLLRLALQKVIDALLATGDPKAAEAAGKLKENFEMAANKLSNSTAENGEIDRGEVNDLLRAAKEGLDAGKNFGVERDDLKDLRQSIGEFKDNVRDLDQKMNEEAKNNNKDSMSEISDLMKDFLKGIDGDDMDPNSPENNQLAMPPLAKALDAVLSALKDELGLSDEMVSKIEKAFETVLKDVTGRDIDIGQKNESGSDNNKLNPLDSNAPKPTEATKPATEDTRNHEPEDTKKPELENMLTQAIFEMLMEELMKELEKKDQGQATQTRNSADNPQDSFADKLEGALSSEGVPSSIAAPIVAAFKGGSGGG